jgi:DNA-binding response OmpR family regulator
MAGLGNMAPHILIIEDNKDLVHLLEVHLGDLSYKVESVYDGVSGLSKIENKTYDLIILDLMLPGMDGLELCRRVRGQANYTPIIMLTAKTSELDRVLGLEMGADDYITKPFSIREMLARVKALLRRVDELKSVATITEDSVLDAGDLKIDPEKRKVTLDGQVLDLTAKEFDLLLYFARHPGRVFTRSNLLDHVWGYGHDGYEHTVNTHINRLRAKIEANPAQPHYILTVWGVGYKFKDL